MNPHRHLGCLLLAASLSGGALVAQPETVRLQSTAFNRPALVEVQGVPAEQAEAAIQAAREAIATIEASFGSGEGNILDQLAAHAGETELKLDPLLFDLLHRAWNFCQWNSGAHGPLGAELYQLWGLHDPVMTVPSPGQIQHGIQLAACERLRLDPTERMVALAKGSRLLLWGFAAGYAVDRAMEALSEAGVENARVVVGRIARGQGPGPAGKGWPIDLPTFTRLNDEPHRIYLQDASIVVAAWEDGLLEIAGEQFPPYLDQRKGRPPQRMVATVVHTDLAVDAQGLAVGLFVLGAFEGQMRLGALRPSPSVIWVEGSREGEPILVEYRWSKVPRP